jgi:Fic family protein
MEIDARLAELTRAKQWLDAFRPLPPAIVEELRSRYDVRLTYHSTAIEGNTLTQSETQVVLEKGITIGGKSLREHLEVIGHKAALDYVYDLANGNTALGEREIREIHSLVMQGQDTADAGAYRRLDVKAAGTEFTYPSHLHVPELMQEFAHWLSSPSAAHAVLTASEAHLRFVSIHPFRDGNGRVGRLLLNLLLLRGGYPIAVIPVQRRAEYINALVEAQQERQPAAIDRLVLECVEASLRETLTLCVSSGYVPKVPLLMSDVSKWLED